MAKSIKFRSSTFRHPGLGHGSRSDRILPRALKAAPSLSAAAEFRLRCVEHARATSVDEAVKGFKRSRATVYRWLRRYDPHNLRTLESRSRRPKQTRTRQWTADQEQAVLRLRQAHPRFGTAKLAVLLAAAAMALSESTIGRILASLTRRRLLIAPCAVRVRHPKPARPYATRVPKDKRVPTTPGELVQLDTVHLRPVPGVERRQFTAVDVVSRCAVVGVRSRATAGTAAAFLDEVLARMPFPVQAIQVDDGSEFMAAFESACQAREIALYVLPPRSPKRNGRVERRNGTCRRECWECDDGDLDLPTLRVALREWEVAYNTERPHQSLDSLTPAAYLPTLAVSHVSD
jgi:transposase InsO family protein